MQARRAPLVTAARAPIAQLLHDLRALGDLHRRAAAVDEQLAAFAAPAARLRAELPAELIARLPRPRRGYARTLVHRCDAFELLLLTWAPGSRAPAHDHAGQDCWLVPLAGAFDVDDYGVAGADGRHAWLVPLRARRLGPGDLDRRDAYEAVHAVTPATPLALSLHLYARPIDRCRVFDLCSARWSWRRLAYDAIAPDIGE